MKLEQHCRNPELSPARDRLAIECYEPGATNATSGCTIWRATAQYCDESGRQEIYAQPWPATGDQWQISTGGGTDARWRPDGRELYFLSPSRTMMAVAIDATAGVRAGPPVPLFRANIAGPLGSGASPMPLTRTARVP